MIRNWRPVGSVGRDAVFGAEFAPFPSPLPPASGGAGPVHSQLAPLDLLRPSVLRTAGSVFGPVNFLSVFCCPTVKVGISQKLPPIALRALRPGPYPKQCRPLLSVPPPLAGGDVGVWGTFLLGVAFRHVICEFYFFFLPVRLPSEIQKLPQDPPVQDSLPRMDLCP